MSLSSEDVRVGGWILSVYKAIRDFNLEDAAFDDYDAIITSARTGELLSAIRSLDLIDGAKFDTYRRLALLKPKVALPILKSLASLGVINVEWDKASSPPSVRSVQSIIKSKAEVLSATAKLFHMEDPTPKAKLILEVLESTVQLPVRETDLASKLNIEGNEEQLISRTLSELVGLGLITKTRETQSGDALLHNPHTFKTGVSEAHRLMTGLSQKDQEMALSLLAHVKQFPGVPFPAKSDKRIIALLAKIGAIDISGVQLKANATAGEFPTAPDAWGVFAGPKEDKTGQDLIDDSKLLLNSLRYGEIYSSPGRGRINSPIVLISALIDRGQVGAATAIGEDYPLPLARGIVSITESRLNPGRYFMELRKRDVAESVRDVIEQNVILPAGEIATPEILDSGGGAFVSPERMRFTRKLPQTFIEARDSMIFDLRTYRNRK